MHVEDYQNVHLRFLPWVLMHVEEYVVANCSTLHKNALLICNFSYQREILEVYVKLRKYSKRRVLRMRIFIFI